jgi:hypothetical protein
MTNNLLEGQIGFVLNDGGRIIQLATVRPTADVISLLLSSITEKEPFLKMPKEYDYVRVSDLKKLLEPSGSIEIPDSDVIAPFSFGREVRKDDIGFYKGETVIFTGEKWVYTKNSVNDRLYRFVNEL